MKVRGAVKFATHSKRDHAIFPFDKLDLKEVEKQTSRIRTKLQFGDGIPTNLQPKFSSTRQIENTSNSPNNFAQNQTISKFLQKLPTTLNTNQSTI